MFDFINNPTVGQTQTGPGGVVYSWDATKWVAASNANAFAPLNSPVFTGNPTAPTPPVGDASQSLADTAFVQTATTPLTHNVGRNLLHNGLMNVAQRGAGPWTTGYTLDRWVISSSGDTVSITQFTNTSNPAPGTDDGIYSLSNTFTGNAAAGSYNAILQKIERVYRLSGQTVTVSFYAQSTAPINLGVNLSENFGTGGSPSASVSLNGQSVAVTASWARYALTFAMPSAAGKTYGSNWDNFTQLGFWFSSGANNATSAGNIGVQSGTVRLWGVQCEIGSVATPLEKLDPRLDLSNCQRFYINGGSYLIGGVSGTGITQNYPITFPQLMRATPTMNGTASGGSGYSGTSVVINGGVGFSVSVTVTSSAFGLNYAWNASADL